ncbi:MAG: hypothetical protein Q8P72_02825 [Candidatus Roizmanbacteria bacterium]|nr:hypothetical protein [Candidatus Roizmanbacteria bacterium]
METLQKKTTHFIKNYKVFLVVLTAVILFLFLRLHNLEKYFVYGLDEEYMALYARTILKDFHIIWIGVSAANVGYYLGPGLVYLTAFFLWIGKNDPLTLGYAATFVSLAGFLTLMFVSYQLFGKRVSFFTSLLYLFSPFALYYDHKYWPLLVPLVCIALYFSIVKMYEDSKFIIAVSFFIATAYHLHLTLWIFWPIIFFALWQNRKKIPLWYWLISGGIFLLITSPLLVFDVIHNFDNILMPLRLVQNLSEGPTHTNHLWLFVTTISKMWIVKSATQNVILSIILALTTICAFVTAGFSSKNKKSFQLLSIISLIFTASFIFYPGPMQGYYATFLLPFWALAAGIFFTRLPKLLALFLISLIIGLNTYSFFHLQTNSDYRDKIEIVKKTSSILDGEGYYLDFDESYRSFGGFRSLFALQGQTPAQSTADGMFGWLYGNEISSNTPTRTVTISRNAHLDIKPLIEQFTVGEFTVYIE